MEQKNTPLTLISVGKLTGLALPEDMLQKLHWQVGTPLYAVETTEGVLLTAYGARTRAHLGVGRELLRDHDAVLRALTE